MARGAPKKVVYTGLIANMATAGCEYLAAAFTGSTAILAEAIHSTVDTGNELLLLLGMKRSGRPTDTLYPFGGDLLTMQLGPDKVLLAVDIQFHSGFNVHDIESVIDRLESRVREKEPTIDRIYIEVDSLKKAAGPSSQAA